MTVCRNSKLTMSLCVKRLWWNEINCRPLTISSHFTHPRPIHFRRLLLLPRPFRDIGRRPSELLRPTNNHFSTWEAYKAYKTFFNTGLWCNIISKKNCNVMKRISKWKKKEKKNTSYIKFVHIIIRNFRWIMGFGKNKLTIFIITLCLSSTTFSLLEETFLVFELCLKIL